MRCIIFQDGKVWNIELNWDKETFDPGWWSKRPYCEIPKYWKSADADDIAYKVGNLCPDLERNVEDIIWWDSLSPNEAAYRLWCRHLTHAHTIVSHDPIAYARIIDTAVYDGTPTIVPRIAKDMLFHGLFYEGESGNGIIHFMNTELTHDEVVETEWLTEYDTPFNKLPDIANEFILAIKKGPAMFPPFPNYFIIPKWLSGVNFIGSRCNYRECNAMIDCIRDAFPHNKGSFIEPKTVWYDAIGMWWDYYKLHGRSLDIEDFPEMVKNHKFNF